MNHKEFRKYVDEMTKGIADKLKDNEEELAFYAHLIVRFNAICEENEELKSQLKGTTHCYDEAEHRQLKKQLSSITLQLEKQQQEFINYLKSINSFETIGNILNKYKEIIERNKDE